jgi:hypothetical protein
VVYRVCRAEKKLGEFKGGADPTSKHRFEKPMLILA